mgnify:CR=1 FL=1
MPLIQVTMVEGRTVEQKHALIRNLSQSMAETLEVPLERIRVALYEISADEWGIALPYGAPAIDMRIAPSRNGGCRCSGPHASMKATVCCARRCRVRAICWNWKALTSALKTTPRCRPTS